MMWEDEVQRAAIYANHYVCETCDSIVVHGKNCEVCALRNKDALVEEYRDVLDHTPRTQDLIVAECMAINEVLLDKNRKYGDSAVNPCRIFSKADPLEQINIRIDDKLNRVMNKQGNEDEDVELDLIGYLILKRVARRVQDEDY